MAMTLGDMTTVATLSRKLASKTATTDPLTQAFTAGSKRVTEQLEQTQVQLSSYGQIKSGFASLASTANNLTTLGKTASASDVSKAAQAFVSAFNSTNAALGTAVDGSGKGAGVLANDSLARLASNDLRRVVTSSSGVADLQKIGISVGAGGSLSVDSQVLEKAMQTNPDAVKSTLAKLGQQASKTATQELSSGGAVGSAMNSLNSRNKTLTTQQTQQQNLAASAQAAIEQSAEQSSSFGGLSAGISAYMKMFSL